MSAQKFAEGIDDADDEIVGLLRTGAGTLRVPSFASLNVNITRHSEFGGDFDKLSRREGIAQTNCPCCSGSTEFRSEFRSDFNIDG